MFTAVAFLVLLGALITIHELGHFIVAKLCGVRVLTFSLGFGPKLIGFTHGDTEYKISVLPLGGYVRMYGDDITAEVPEHERHVAYLEKSTLQKMAIAFAGPAANLLLTLVVLFSLAVGSETVALPVVGSVLPGEPAALAGLKADDRIVAVEGTPVATFDDLVKAIAPRANMPTALTIERPGSTAPLTLSVTPTPSPSFDPFDDTPIGRIGLLTVKALPAVAVAADSPAARAGVVFGDTVKSIDGVDVSTRDDFFAALDAKPATAPFTLVVERRAPMKDRPDVLGVASRHTIHVGAASTADAAALGAITFAVTSDEITGAVATAVDATADVVRVAAAEQQRRRGLASIDGVVGGIEADSPAASRNLVVRGHRVVAVDGKPLQFANDLPTALKKDVDGIHVLGLVDERGVGSTFALRLQPSTRREAAGQKIVGITLSAANGGAATTTREVGVVEGVQRAFVDTGKTIRGVALGYVLLFTGQVGLDQLGGPVMLANIAGEAARSGLDVFLGTMAVISVNLALLNLLPVPVLDGGHILLFAIEAIRRRRLSVEARIRATTIGLVFVGGLTVIALLNDVLSIFR